MTLSNIQTLLGDSASHLLNFESKSIPKSQLTLPSSQYINAVFAQSDRNNRVLASMARLHNTGKLAKTGYMSILPVDQGIEHGGGASFAKNPEYFDPENIIRLALEGGCNAVASTFGVLGLTARKFAHKIPYIVKINHNESLTYPEKYDQTLFGKVKNAWNMGAVGIGATIYFGSKESNRQIIEISEAFSQAHELGMLTILWCYLRNSNFKISGIDYHDAADLTAQANHLGVTLQADIIKQKMPTHNGGFLATKHAKTSPLVYEKLSSQHPIDLCRYQVANCYMGKIPLINSGGASDRNSDLAEAVKLAVINKRAGGAGLILGRKAFQKPFSEGVKLLHSVQDVYLNSEISIA